jgi:hypothetical protein
MENHFSGCDCLNNRLMRGTIREHELDKASDRRDLFHTQPKGRTEIISKRDFDSS